MSYHRVDLEGPIGTENGQTLYQITTYYMEMDVRHNRGHVSAAYTEDGKILRWCSNDAVVPRDIMEGTDWPYQDEMNAVRDADLSAFVAQYKAARFATPTPEQRAEEAFERRAAFGPGEEVVDILTGERYTT